MKFNSMDAVSKKIQMAHSQVDDRLAAGEKELKDVYDTYNDILSDIEALRGAVMRIGCPRTSDLLRQSITGLEALKPIMEEELAKPR